MLESVCLDSAHCFRVEIIVFRRTANDNVHYCKRESENQINHLFSVCADTVKITFHFFVNGDRRVSEFKI